MSNVDNMPDDLVKNLIDIMTTKYVEQSYDQAIDCAIFIKLMSNNDPNPNRRTAALTCIQECAKILLGDKTTPAQEKRLKSRLLILRTTTSGGQAGALSAGVATNASIRSPRLCRKTRAIRFARHVVLRRSFASPFFGSGGSLAPPLPRPLSVSDLPHRALSASPAPQRPSPCPRSAPNPLHPRPQHGWRARTVAGDRHEGRRFRQADRRGGQLLHPVRARPRPPQGPRPSSWRARSRRRAASPRNSAPSPSTTASPWATTACSIRSPRARSSPTASNTWPTRTAPTRWCASVTATRSRRAC